MRKQVTSCFLLILLVGWVSAIPLADYPIFKQTMAEMEEVQAQVRGNPAAIEADKLLPRGGMEDSPIPSRPVTGGRDDSSSDGVRQRGGSNDSPTAANVVGAENKVVVGDHSDPTVRGASEDQPGSVAEGTPALRGKSTQVAIEGSSNMGENAPVKADAKNSAPVSVSAKPTQNVPSGEGGDKTNTLPVTNGMPPSTGEAKKSSPNQSEGQSSGEPHHAQGSNNGGPVEGSRETDSGKNTSDKTSSGSEGASETHKGGSQKATDTTKEVTVNAHTASVDAGHVHGDHHKAPKQKVISGKDKDKVPPSMMDTDADATVLHAMPKAAWSNTRLMVFTMVVVVVCGYAYLYFFKYCVHGKRGIDALPFMDTVRSCFGYKPVKTVDDDVTERYY